MVDLDCESPQSSLNSLSRIFGIDEMGLREFLASIDLDRHYELNNPQLMAGPELLRLFELEGGRQRESIDRVYWFHLTRVLSSTQFQDGILPLGQVLPSIWTMLFKLFTGTHHEARLRAMQAAGVADRHFNFKTNNSDQWGPFAMLVRDVAFFSAELHNHDYLRTPEIVEDICNGYREQFGENIQAAIEHSMVPTIVKFWSTYQGYGLESAMCYAYCCVHKEHCEVQLTLASMVKAQLCLSSILCPYRLCIACRKRVLRLPAKRVNVAVLQADFYVILYFIFVLCADQPRAGPERLSMVN